jgi:hypothetical protein
MKEKNLDIYGDPPIPWSRALDQLNAWESGPGKSTFLSTTRPDGAPHVAGIGAFWVDDRFYFTSGPQTQKSRNLAANPRCAIALTLPDMDLVVEGTARRVTDDDTLHRVAKIANDGGWPASVKDGSLTADFSAPSAGPPPWDLYVMEPTVAFGVAYKEPYGAMRWRFDE